MLREILPQMTVSMIHEAPPQMNATANTDMSTGEHHYAPRDVSMLHETSPQMVQVEDERLATQFSTPANTRALS